MLVIPAAGCVMKELLTPICAESLVDVFISRFEELILSGKLAIGQRLPSERDLAGMMGVSRPVVHEGLVSLQARGLITLRPRIGAYVNDYRKQGSIAMLESLIQYRHDEMDPSLFESLLQMRELFEIETARLASLHRTGAHLDEFREIIECEKNTGISDVPAVIELDFSFHHLTAMATGNVVYPLIVNSFKPVYTNLTGQFFRTPGVVPEVFKNHEKLYAAIKAKNPHEAVAIMRELLSTGALFLRRAVSVRKGAGERRVV